MLAIDEFANCYAILVNDLENKGLTQLWGDLYTPSSIVTFSTADKAREAIKGLDMPDKREPRVVLLSIQIIREVTNE